VWYTFKNAKLIFPHRIVYGGIQVKGNKIHRIFEGEVVDNIGKVIDCKQMYLAPGFIDLHVHGGGGADFMDGDEAAVQTVLKAHGRHGTTSMLPTTLSSSREKVIRALQTIENAQNAWERGPRILGSHLEGNFFSMARKGAQDPAYIIPPTEENYLPLLEAVSNIKRISCAPEVENACNFAGKMSSKGILMSAAHSDAGYDDFLKGTENGFSHVTHLYNGSSYIHSPNYYCRIGICESALLLDDVSVEVIADGKHVPKELLRLIYKIKGSDKMNLCTDAMCAADMPDGNYKLGALDVFVEDEVAILTDRSSFAGSVCTGDRAVRTIYKMAELPLYEAVKMMTATPAKLIGEYDRIGSLTEGKLADFNIFDEDIRIKYTMIDGREYNNDL